MAARITTETCEMHGIRSEVRNARIDCSACTLHKCGETLTPMHFARNFKHEPQSLLDQVLEFAAAQGRLRLGPAVEIIRYFDRGFHRHAIGIKPYIRIYGSLVQIARSLLGGAPGQAVIH